MAMHYCPWEMQKHVLNSGLFKVTEGDVDPKDVDADYVFDARGCMSHDYIKLTSPVNSVILGKPKWNTLENLWTEGVATPNGWTFVIPMHSTSPSHKESVGYIYKNQITKTEDAEKNFQEFSLRFTGDKTHKFSNLGTYSFEKTQKNLKTIQIS